MNLGHAKKLLIESGYSLLRESIDVDSIVSAIEAAIGPENENVTAYNALSALERSGYIKNMAAKQNKIDVVETVSQMCRNASSPVDGETDNEVVNLEKGPDWVYVTVKTTNSNGNVFVGNYECVGGFDNEKYDEEYPSRSSTPDTIRFNRSTWVESTFTIDTLTYDTSVYAEVGGKKYTPGQSLEMLTETGVAMPVIIDSAFQDKMYKFLSNYFAKNPIVDD